MNDSGQLYVTGTSEPDQYAIDNYSGHQFSGGELMPVEEYFRVSGYFGSYGPHMFAQAPKMLHIITMIRDADKDCKRDGLSTMPAHIRAMIDEAIAAANGESQR